MKKQPKKTPSAILLTESADRFLKKLALLIAFIPPLADSLILFPLTQIALANGGTGVIYQILSTVSQIVSLGGFFAAVALAVYCIFADALSALGRVFALQGISFLVSVVFLRTFMLWFLALIDDALHLVLALSNYTLYTVTSDNGMMLVWSAISLFTNVVVLMALMLIVVAVALLLRRKQNTRIPLDALVDRQGEAHPRFSLCYRIATLIYLLQALVNQIYQTVGEVAGATSSEIIANLANVIAPYFLLAIFAFVGYWVMQTATVRIAVKVLSICTTDKKINAVKKQPLSDLP